MGFNRRFDKKFDFRDFSLSMSTYIPRDDLRMHFILSWLICLTVLHNIFWHTSGRLITTTQFSRINALLTWRLIWSVRSHLYWTRFSHNEDGCTWQPTSKLSIHHSLSSPSVEDICPVDAGRFSHGHTLQQTWCRYYNLCPPERGVSSCLIQQIYSCLTVSTQ